MKTGKIIIIFISIVVGFGLVVFLGARYTERAVYENHPVVLREKLERFRNDQELMDSIGGYEEFECSYNIKEFNEKDTFDYKLKIIGKRKEFFLRSGKCQGKWSLESRS